MSALQNRTNTTKDYEIYSTLKIISSFKTRGIEVTLVWVPAHVGVPGNEKADQLAKAATRAPTEELYIPGNLQDARRVIASRVQILWQQRWDNSTESRHYKSIVSKVSSKSQFESVNRSKEKLISRFRLGKCALNRYLFIIGKHPTGKCTRCPEEDETPIHFLMECPAQAGLREKLKTGSITKCCKCSSKMSSLRLSSFNRFVVIFYNPTSDTNVRFRQKRLLIIQADNSGTRIRIASAI
ncbi:RNase H family protein [Staphylococcus aureus]